MSLVLFLISISLNERKLGVTMTASSKSTMLTKVKFSNSGLESLNIFKLLHERRNKDLRHGNAEEISLGNSIGMYSQSIFRTCSLVHALKSSFDVDINDDLIK